MNKKSNSEVIFSSGSILLDHALRTGGIPGGSICEIFGPMGSGKTTLCQHIIAEAQRNGSMCVYIDVDQTLDIHFAEQCGVNINRLFISQKQRADQVLSIAETMARSGAIGVLVIDPVSSLIASAEFERSPEHTSIRSVDLIISQTLNRLVKVLQRTETLIIFTNITTGRSKVIYHRLKENPAKVALKFHSALRLRLSLLETISQNQQIIGQRIGVQIVKNRFAPCLDRTELDIMYNDGIRKTGEIFDLGIRLSIIEQCGSNYCYRNTLLGPGRDSAINFFEHNHSLMEEVEQVIRQRL
ncbi:MAG: ATPase domain-containing protein [Chloroflexota bacterium]|nr:ATPase domain-containing protein [Chloroflexota bacterium]